MTAVKVLDASALGAALFIEQTAETVAAQLRNARLVAPKLLAYEIANICSKKIRNSPSDRETILEQFATWEGIGIDLVDVDASRLPLVAEAFGLSAYDASYLWLAWQLDAELVTLDRQLARAAAALPQA